MTEYNQKLFEHVHGQSDRPSERMRKRMRWVTEHIPAGVKTILDLGAGPGHLSSSLADRGFEVTSAELVFGSLKRFKGNRVQANCVCLPFKTDSFDLVLCAEVIEHLGIRDRELCVREIRRIAREYVLVTLPDDEDLNQMLIRCDRCGYIFHAWGHLESFDKSSMKTLFPVPPIQLSSLAASASCYYPPLLAIRHKIFKTYGYDSYVVCPKCLNTDISEPKRSFPVKVLDRLNYWLGFESHCGWMLAIYKKNESAQRNGSIFTPRESFRNKQRPLFPRVDRFFMALQTQCELIEAGCSQRLGLLIRRAVILAHESLLKLDRHVKGSLFNSEAVLCLPAQFPPGFPCVPSITPSAKTVSRMAEELAQGFCRIDSAKTVNINEISWSPDPFGEVSTFGRFLFHCLDGVRELVDAYWLTKNNAYLDQAKTIAQRWISECLFIERYPLVWDDHITAIRMLILCRLWVACHCAKKDSPEFAHEMRSAVLRHGRRLALNGFYRPRHNHGITQAYALFAVGLLVPSLPEASEWAELGRTRLERQMAENVSCEGMHREHSPYYHFYVFNQFLYAYQFGVEYGIQFSREFAERLKKMLLCGAYILKPDGTLPAIGDTCKSSPILLSPEDATDWFGEAGRMYRYSSSLGTDGTQPDVTSVLLPNAGIAVLRSGWGSHRPFQDEIFAAVRICTYDTSHIHRDQGSFELYAYGGDLIVDSGGPYGYGEPMRDFFLSTAAHNTIVVDGKNQEIGKAEIRHWRTSNAFDLLVMEHRSYPTVLHRRTIVFVRPYYFVLVDQLNADVSHAYTQLFHLSPSLTARLEGLTIRTTSRSIGPTIEFVPLLEAGLSVRLHTGARGPVQGWVSTGERQKIANTVIEYERSGARAQFAVVLVPQAAGTSLPVCARMDNLPIGRRIIVTVAGRRDEILIAKDEQVTLS